MCGSGGGGGASGVPSARAIRNTGARGGSTTGNGNQTATAQNKAAAKVPYKYTSPAPGTSPGYHGGRTTLGSR